MMSSFPCSVNWLSRQRREVLTLMSLIIGRRAWIDDIPVRIINLCRGRLSIAYKMSGNAHVDTMLVSFSPRNALHLSNDH